MNTQTNDSNIKNMAIFILLTLTIAFGSGIAHVNDYKDMIALTAAIMISIPAWIGD